MMKKYKFKINTSSDKDCNSELGLGEDTLFISQEVALERLEALFESVDQTNALSLEYIGESEDGRYHLYKNASSKEERQSSNSIESYEYGFQLGNQLRKFHNLQKEQKSDWSGEFEIRIMKILHEYGLIQNKGYKDYLMIDFLQDSKNLLKGHTSIDFLYYEDLSNLRIHKDGSISFFKEASFITGDPYYLFNKISKLAEENKYYATGMIDGYFNGDTPNIFFKQIALYHVLDRMEDNLPILSYEVIHQEVEYLIKIYLDFTQFRPQWYLSAREELLNERGGF